MNTDTGRIYRTIEEINAAKERGEPVVEVSPLVAELMESANKLADEMLGADEFISEADRLRKARRAFAEGCRDKMIRAVEAERKE